MERIRTGKPLYGVLAFLCASLAVLLRGADFILLEIHMPGILTAAEPLAVWVFCKEKVRILAELKRYVEAQDSSGTPE